MINPLGGGAIPCGGEGQLIPLQDSGAKLELLERRRGHGKLTLRLLALNTSQLHSIFVAKGRRALPPPNLPLRLTPPPPSPSCIRLQCIIL